MKRHSIRGVLMAAAFTASAAAPSAQTPEDTLKFVMAENALGATVTGAPYSADATTTITQTLGDGTRINRTVTARVARDSEGRIRREQTILGLGALDPAADAQPIVTIVDPVARVQYVLVPQKREARRLRLLSFDAGRGIEEKLRALSVPARKLDETRREGEPPPPPPPPPSAPGERRAGRRDGVANGPEPLGTRQIEGVAAVGMRRTETIPAGRIGNDRPIVVTDERWESPDLHVVVLSEHHDPRTGDVEYRLTNISRAEPAGDLFSVPPEFGVVEAPPPPPPAPPR